MPTFIFLGLLFMSTIGAVVAWHARVVGQPLTLPQLGIASFGVLNILICLWELCLFYRHDRVRRNGAALVAHFGERRWPALGRLLWAPIGWRNVLHPDMWADVWAHYSVFDPAYMDSISFGYTIDIGNGFTSIAPPSSADAPIGTSSTASGGQSIGGGAGAVGSSGEAIV